MKVLRILQNARRNLVMRLQGAAVRHYFSPGQVRYVSWAEHEKLQQQLADQAYFHFVVEPLLDLALVTLACLGAAIALALDWHNFVAQMHHNWLCIGAMIVLLVATPVSAAYAYIHRW